MEHPVSYHQHCPVCGRNLSIAVNLLGRRVYCQHCGGGFIASDAPYAAELSKPGPRGVPRLDVVDALIERAEVVLGRGGSRGVEDSWPDGP